MPDTMCTGMLKGEQLYANVAQCSMQGTHHAML